MNYYNNNLDSLLFIKPKKFYLPFLVLLILIIIIIFGINIEVFDSYDIYVEPKIENNKIILSTNILLENTEKFLLNSKIEYKNKQYQINKSTISESKYDIQNNLAYSKLDFEIELNDDFQEHTLIKVKVLNNKQRLIYKIKNIIK